jgi:6,7-dimethyl-8-ribityllumazine synthase
MSTNAPAPVTDSIRPDARVAIVAARFNAEIVEELTLGCRRRLAEADVTSDRVETFHVPGAFELPIAAKVAAMTGRFAAVVCLGCVIRGDTPHFDYVAGEAARGIQNVSIETGVPIVFGVLTTNTVEQARDRIGGSHGHAGEKAAEAALEMIAVLEKIRRS